MTYFRISSHFVPYLILLLLIINSSYAEQIARKSRTDYFSTKCKPGEENELINDGDDSLKCRSVCEEGYYRSAEYCVKDETFTPHVRRLGYFDDCYSDEVRKRQPLRVFCHTKCPEGPQWTSEGGECVYQSASE